MKVVRRLLGKRFKGKTYDVWRTRVEELKAHLVGLRERKIDIARFEELGRRRGFERVEFER